MARILITNHGTHSAEKWAMTTAEMIFPLDDNKLVGERLIAAQKFQTRLAELLSPHHAAVQDTEKSKLQDDAAEHYSTPHSAEDYIDHAVSDVVEAAAGTPWAAHFADPDVQDAVKHVIADHICTSQNIERLWHAAHNRSEHGDAYMARYHG